MQVLQTCTVHLLCASHHEEQGPQGCRRLVSASPLRGAEIPLKLAQVPERQESANFSVRWPDSKCVWLWRPNSLCQSYSALPRSRQAARTVCKHTVWLSSNIHKNPCQPVSTSGTVICRPLCRRRSLRWMEQHKNPSISRERRRGTGRSSTREGPCSYGLAQARPLPQEKADPGLSSGFATHDGTMSKLPTQLRHLFSFRDMEAVMRAPAWGWCED